MTGEEEIGFGSTIIVCIAVYLQFYRGVLFEPSGKVCNKGEAFRSYYVAVDIKKYGVGNKLFVSQEPIE